MDVAFFNSLNSHYDSQVVALLGKHRGRSVSEDQIGGLFAAAYGKAASVSNASKEFDKAGIHPFRDDLSTEEDSASIVV